MLWKPHGIGLFLYSGALQKAAAHAAECRALVLLGLPHKKDAREQKFIYIQNFEYIFFNIFAKIYGGADIHAGACKVSRIRDSGCSVPQMREGRDRSHRKIRKEFYQEKRKWKLKK